MIKLNIASKWFWLLFATLFTLIILISITTARPFLSLLLIQIAITAISGWMYGITGGVLVGILLSILAQIFIARPSTGLTAEPPLVFVASVNTLLNIGVGSLIGFISNNMRRVRLLSERLMQEQEILRQERRQLQEEVTRRQQIEVELQKALIKAEAANKAKSAFLANMSHELRTPLAAIIGYNELLQERLDDSLGLSKYLDRSLTSAAHLQGIITDILDISRIEAGQLSIEKKQFSLVDCLTAVLDIIIVESSTKNLTLYYHLHPNTPAQLIGDSLHLQQVLINLLSNAVKFTNKGHITITVQAQPQEGETWQYHFTVQDTGQGIPLADQEHIFETFKQLDDSSTKKQGGSGLGLAICKHLVEAMGGHIWVESEVGQGATFHFTIQVAVPANNTHLRTQGGVPHQLNKALIIEQT